MCVLHEVAGGKRKRACGKAQPNASFKFRNMMELLLGMGGGPKGAGMPRGTFREVLDFLMPSWDPLRLGVAGTGP